MVISAYKHNCYFHVISRYFRFNRKSDDRCFSATVAFASRPAHASVALRKRPAAVMRKLIAVKPQDPEEPEDADASSAIDGAVR